jgi:hypothetical protein
MENLDGELLFQLSQELKVPDETATAPLGARRFVSITGGSFEGPRLKGQVLSGGGYWVLVRPDGAAEVDARTTLRTDDGQLIYMHYRGLVHGPPAVMQALRQGDSSIDPSEYYHRTTPLFDTGSEQYEWLNRMVAVGIGKRTPTGVEYTVHAVS